MGYHKGEDTLMEGAVEMYQWERQIQSIVDEIDRCIRQQDSEALTLQALSRRLGYSESYPPEVRGDLGHAASGLSAGQEGWPLPEGGAGQREKPAGHCAGVWLFLPRGVHPGLPASLWRAPGEYRRNPRPVVLRTKLRPIDRYFFGTEEIGMIGSCQG